MRHLDSSPKLTNSSYSKSMRNILPQGLKLQKVKVDYPSPSKRSGGFDQESAFDYVDKRNRPSQKDLGYARRSMTSSIRKGASSRKESSSKTLVLPKSLRVNLDKQKFQD